MAQGASIEPHAAGEQGSSARNILEIRTEAGRERWDIQLDHLDWRTFRTGDMVAVEGKDFAFTPVHVDHSVPAADAFIIETGGMTIAYTGDLRMHGARPDLTMDFLQALESRHIDVLLCEGTRVSSGEDPDDQFLREMGEAFRKRMGEAAPEAVHVPCSTENDVRLQLSAVFMAGSPRSRTKGSIAHQTGVCHLPSGCTHAD